MPGTKSLPRIMVAPNGARRTKTDHPAIPMSVEEIVETTSACFDAGADGIHIHVRNAAGKHVLDAGLYTETLAELKKSVPGMALQITTEAVGRYTPSEQRKLVRDVMPDYVSISLAEMLAENDIKSAMNFYQWSADAGIAVQHILYGPEDAALWDKLFGEPGPFEHKPQLLFVLGRYARDQESHPSDLDPFVNWLAGKDEDIDWAVCAFGRGETDCLTDALKKGGKVRVGFENSLWNADGSVAKDNAERVREVKGKDTMFRPTNSTEKTC